MSSNNKLQLGTEELNIFKEGLNDLLKTSLAILNSLERHDLVDRGDNNTKRTERRRVIETITKRTNLYQNYFGQTTSRDMDEHYKPFYGIYRKYYSPIIQMVGQLCSADDTAVTTQWLNNNKISIIIDITSGVILHLQVIFQLGMELQKTVERKITVKYKDMISKANAEDRSELTEQMMDEKDDSPELAYIDRYLLALITVFLAISQNSTDRRQLKLAASHMMETMPNGGNDSNDGGGGGGGLFGGLGGLGGILTDVLKNIPGGGSLTDGGDVGQVITDTLKAALGPDGPMKDVLRNAGKSHDVGELTKNLSAAINNPELNKVIDSQVGRFKNSNIAHPPKVGDKVPNETNQSSSSSTPSIVLSNKPKIIPTSTNNVKVVNQVPHNEQQNGPTGVVVLNTVTKDHTAPVYEIVELTDDISIG